MPLFDRFGAELMNVAVGVIAELVLAVLRLSGAIGQTGWRQWSLMALSFVALPWLLVLGRLLSPALERSFAVIVKEPEPEVTAPAARAPASNTPSSD